MTIGIVVSRADSASVHIGEHLHALADWERDGDAFRTPGFELRFFDDWHLELEGVAADFDADPNALVFASRHSGGTGPILTAHFTGNFGVAEHGGDDRALAPACPSEASVALDALATHAPDGYDVGMECTHHGPTDPGAPSMFVEVGSDEPQWADPEAARAAARAILALDGSDATAAERDVVGDATAAERSVVGDATAAERSVVGDATAANRTLVAFGGGHYAPRATRIATETNWAVGHVAADWCLDDLGDPETHESVVDAVFERSGATRAVVDGEHPALESVIETLGYRVVSETWVRAVGGVPLALAEAIEADLSRVDDGLRFGAPAVGCEDEAYDVVDLPDALWADAYSVDGDAALEAAREHAVAYETTENGNRVRGRAAFADAAAYDAYIDALAALLREKYDTVERREDEVVAATDSFDPALAADRGVPEGPKFGRLAAGQPVTVDGREVTLADVTSRVTNTYYV